MATVSLCCYGNIPSCLTLRLLSAFPEIQPLPPIGCEHMEGFHLSPCDVRSTQFKPNNLSLCSCEKSFAFCLMLVPHFLTGCPPPFCPSFSGSLCEYDSVSPPLFFPPLLLKIVLNQPLHHITVSLWPHFNNLSLSLPFSGGVQATAAHTSRPEPGGSEHRAAQGQGKNLLHLMSSGHHNLSQPGH